LEDAADRTDGEVVLDDFRLVRVLGTGGSGTTYEAVDLPSGARVAIKEIRLSGAARWKDLERFEREATVLARLSHPGIPRCREHRVVESPADTRMFLVQDLADGPSLAQQAVAGWRADEPAAVSLAHTLLEVAEYLHELQPPVVHRDIKPQNVILPEGRPAMLVDFGTAVDRVPRGQSVTVAGTYGYMAPEQTRGSAEPRSDLYAIGCTLIFALTGASPTELPQRRMRFQIRGRLAVSNALSAWLERMTAPALEDRFDSARAAREALERIATRGAAARRAVPFVFVALATAVAVCPLPTYSGRPREALASVEPPPPAAPVGRNPSKHTTLRVVGDQPGVDVFVDGTRAGPITWGSFSVETGQHAIKIAGSERYEPYEDEVMLRDDRDFSLGRVSLKVRKGKVTLDSSTPGARIVLALGELRRELPMLPVSMDLDPSQRSWIEATRPGYLPYRRPVDFSDGHAEKSLNVRMARAGSPPLPAEIHIETLRAFSYVPVDSAFVTLEASPDLLCSLDGKPAETLPIARREVSAGRHTVTFVAYDGRTTPVRGFTVDANRIAVVRAELVGEVMDEVPTVKYFPGASLPQPQPL
jgi:serine/threonine protein kinase